MRAELSDTELRRRALDVQATFLDQLGRHDEALDARERAARLVDRPADAASSVTATTVDGRKVRIAEAEILRLAGRLLSSTHR